jgi:hypothetical protein
MCQEIAISYSGCFSHLHSCDFLVFSFWVFVVLFFTKNRLYDIILPRSQYRYLPFLFEMSQNKCLYHPEVKILVSLIFYISLSFFFKKLRFSLKVVPTSKIVKDSLGRLLSLLLFITLLCYLESRCLILDGGSLRCWVKYVTIGEWYIHVIVKTVSWRWCLIVQFHEVVQLVRKICREMRRFVFLQVHFNS